MKYLVIWILSELIPEESHLNILDEWSSDRSQQTWNPGILSDHEDSCSWFCCIFWRNFMNESASGGRLDLPSGTIWSPQPNIRTQNTSADYMINKDDLKLRDCNHDGLTVWTRPCHRTVCDSTWIKPARFVMCQLFPGGRWSSSRQKLQDQTHENPSTTNLQSGKSRREMLESLKTEPLMEEIHFFREKIGQSSSLNSLSSDDISSAPKRSFKMVIDDPWAV